VLILGDSALCLISHTTARSNNARGPSFDTHTRPATNWRSSSSTASDSRSLSRSRISRACSGWVGSRSGYCLRPAASTPPIRSATNSATTSRTCDGWDRNVPNILTVPHCTANPSQLYPSASYGPAPARSRPGRRTPPDPGALGHRRSGRNGPPALQKDSQLTCRQKLSLATGMIKDRTLSVQSRSNGLSTDPAAVHRQKPCPRRPNHHLTRPTQPVPCARGQCCIIGLTVREATLIRSPRPMFVVAPPVSRRQLAGREGPRGDGGGYRREANEPGIRCAKGDRTHPRPPGDQS
jgi:hypothetical protein